jgi:hypothetical protein
MSTMLRICRPGRLSPVCAPAIGFLGRGPDHGAEVIMRVD